jgi:hypothetical protein
VASFGRKTTFRRSAQGEIAAFLYQQLILTFTPERLDRIKDFNRDAAIEMMKTLPLEEEDNLTRGYDEVVCSASTIPSGGRQLFLPMNDNYWISC